MSWNPSSQNNNGTNNQYTPGGFEKAKLRKLLLLAVGILATIAIIVLIVHFLPESQQSKYTKSATAAARKHTPNAKASDVKVADGFATAIVSSRTAEGQGKAGNTTVFKVNKDGSMSQIANGSSFSPLDLLNLGIPLSTQAKLSGTSINQVKQNLANTCNYTRIGTPGYSGFDGSFNPDGWQIDSLTLSSLEQTVSDAVSSKNAKVTPDKAVICVNAVRKNSNATLDTKTSISTFTIQAQFITNDGTLTTHTLTFATGPKHYRNYTLDGLAL